MDCCYISGSLALGDDYWLFSSSSYEPEDFASYVSLFAGVWNALLKFVSILGGLWTLPPEKIGLLGSSALLKP